MYPSGNGFRNILNWQQIGSQNKQTCGEEKIFVDETMLKIDGQDYWLWV
jgi:transposase-like protein